MASESGVVILESREGDCFEVPIKEACLSGIINEMFDGDEAMDDKSIPLPNFSSDVLRKVIEFGKHYQEEQMTPILTPLSSSNIDNLVQNWYAKFVKLPQKQLFELVVAANYLDIKPLLDLTVLAVAFLIKGKSAAELREIFSDSGERADEGS